MTRYVWALVLTLAGGGIATIGAFFVAPALGVLTLGGALFGLGVLVACGRLGVGE